MDNYSHFLITRFNLPLYDSDKHNVPTRTDEWLDDRFTIFERYCLPSVAGQTTDNFVWLCLFGSDTPPHYRERIEGYRKVCPRFVPVFYDERQTAELAVSLRASISELVDPGARYIVTTNLDNDDAIRRDFIRRIQSCLVPSHEPHFYSFSYGYQYFTAMDFVLKMRLDNNHFLTLMEPTGQRFETVVAFRHARVDKYFDTTYLRSRRGMWFEVVHRNNVSNDLRIYFRARPILMLYGRRFIDFGIRIKVSGPRQMVISLLVLPFKYVATGIRRLWTKSERLKDGNSVRCEATDKF